MRKARDFMLMFDPRSLEDMLAVVATPDGAYVRQVMSYWDMAASLVVNGAIDRKMFQDANGEYLAVYGKIEPFIPQMREMFQNPNFLKNLEDVALSLPNARQTIDSTRERIRGMIAARAKASQGATA
ncbi:MAG: hypothetical protein ABJC09_04220 [Terriglobia bacterium]